jgi:hypothetical protein
VGGGNGGTKLRDFKRVFDKAHLTGYPLQQGILFRDLRATAESVALDREGRVCFPKQGSLFLERGKTEPFALQSLDT